MGDVLQISQHPKFRRHGVVIRRGSELVPRTTGWLKMGDVSLQELDSMFDAMEREWKEWEARFHSEWFKFSEILGDDGQEL